jgi:PAS domain S-box-containing protein
LNIQTEIDFPFAEYLINQILEAAFFLSEDAEFIYVNNAISNLTGYSREELLSMNLGDLDIDFTLHNWSKQWKYLININHLYFKSRYRTKEGKIFVGEINFRYIKYQNTGFCCGFLYEQTDELLAVSLDTWFGKSQKLTENNLQPEISAIISQNFDKILKFKKSGIRSLLEATNAGIFLIQGTTIYYVNPAVELLTGYTKQEILSDFDLTKLFKNREYLSNLAHKSEYQEIQIITKEGQEKWLVGAVTHLDSALDFDDQELELLIAIDITNYKLAELELHQTLEQAKELIKLRANLVSILCHQFRTPLNVISFSNSLIQRNIDKWKSKKTLVFLKYIQTAVLDINHVLDDILLFAKIESNQLIVKPIKINLIRFCKNLIKNKQFRSSDKSIIFNNLGQCAEVWMDRKILEPILQNLLDNAIKYSPPDTMVNLIVNCESDRIIFDIQDQGIGIPEIDQEKLFEPFYRGSNVNEIPGTGLGLSIVKTLVDLCGGEITVFSELGVGTTFTLVLPSIKPITPETS